MAKINDNPMTGAQMRTEDRQVLARGEGVSAWRQIADALEADIASGRSEPGAQLPTEADLASRFAVNRHTVRRALASLAERGLLRATRGRGTFVERRPLAYPIGPRTRFSEIVSRSGREPGGELLACTETIADEETARALAVPAGSAVLRFETMRSADGAPVSFATSHLPLPRFAGVERILAHGISSAFAQYGVGDYRRATTRVTARMAGGAIARELELAPGRAVLVVESVNSDAAGRPIQATTAFFAADRVEIIIET